MKLYNQFKKAVYEGQSGKNRGLPIGLPKLNKLINGIQKKRYDLCFAAEGVGKSAFVANSYVLNPYEYYIKQDNKNVDLQILWFALEIDVVSIISKMFCWKVYENTRILISPNNVLSKGDNKVSAFAQERIEEYETYFDNMLTRVQIIDSPMSPSDIEHYISNFAKNRGYYKKDDKGIIRYIPDNPLEHVIIIVDTLGNLNLQNINGKTDKKTTIDHHSALCRDIYRNRLGYTICNVMHSNRSISTTDRAKHGEIFPNKDDIKDSSQPSADANTVIAIFNPMDYINPNNNLHKFMGYDISQLKEKFRAVGVLKNREGPPNKRIGCLYLGEIGLFQELPLPDQLSTTQYEFINNIKTYDKS